VYQSSSCGMKTILLTLCDKMKVLLVRYMDQEFGDNAWRPRYPQGISQIIDTADVHQFNALILKTTSIITFDTVILGLLLLVIRILTATAPF